MSEKTITVTTASGRKFDIPAIYRANVYAVVPCYEFLWEGENLMSPLSGFGVSHIPTGNSIAEFKHKKSARAFCLWMARHFADYDPANPEHEANRKALMGEIVSVVLSYRGHMAW